MTIFFRRLLLASALLLCAASIAQAKSSITPLLHENPLDEARCNALQQQFAKASTGRPVDNSAKEAASQGAILCRTGHYTEGLATLEKALIMIGETPVK